MIHGFNSGEMEKDLLERAADDYIQQYDDRYKKVATKAFIDGAIAMFYLLESYRCNGKHD